MSRPAPDEDPPEHNGSIRLDLAVAAAGIGSFDWYVRDNVLIFDERCCRIFGFDPQHFDSRIESFWAALLPEDAPEVERAVATAMATCGEYAAEYRVRHTDGSVHWVEGRGRVIAGPDGLAERMLGVAVDRTEVRRARDFSRAAELEEARRAGRPEQARRVLAYTAALAEADSLPEVIDTVATTVLPAFGAAGMLVSLVETGQLRLAGHSGYSPRAVQMLRLLGLDDDAPIAEVLRTRTPLFVPSRGAYLAQFPGKRDLVEATGKQAWAFLPLTVSGRALGTLTLSFDVAREIAPEERSLLVSVGGLIAQTVARARMRDLERTLAAELQAQLLPRALPEPNGVTVRARYLPATDGMGVGGDWYDVLELPEQRIGLVIGDVQGHNMRAAAVMGQLRTALRAYAAEGHDPAAVFSRTNRLMSDLDPTLFATCCYVVLDLRSGTATIALAGHPPPLLRSVDGNVSCLLAPVGPPLGVAPEYEYRTRDVVLAPRELVVLYTDGLVEDSRRSLEVGTEALIAVLEEAADDELDELADRLVAVAVAGGHRSDDIAALVVRHDGLDASDRPVRARTVVDRADPRAARSARDFIAGHVDAPEMLEVRETCTLLVSEVVTNALRHTEGEVVLELWRYRRRLRVEVSDEMSRGPVQAGHGLLDDSGRGVPLMDALSDRWGTAPRGAGKVVWFELDLPD